MRARSRRCCVLASIRWSRCRNADFTREALNKLEFFGVIDFFLSETAQHADVVLPGSLQEEEEGVTCSGEGRVIHIQKAVDPPGNARPDSEIICELARRLGKGKYFPYQSTREIFDELREASRGGIADYYGITYEKIDQQMGVFWPCPDRGSSRERPICSKAASRFIQTASAISSRHRVARERRSGRATIIRSTSPPAAS